MLEALPHTNVRWSAMHALPNFTRAEYQSGAAKLHTKWRLINQSDNRYQMIRPFARPSSRSFALCRSQPSTPSPDGLGILPDVTGHIVRLKEVFASSVVIVRSSRALFGTHDRT